jgi:peroxidase
VYKLLRALSAVSLASLAVPASADVNIFLDRTYDGSYNNLTPGYDQLGAAGTSLRRLTAPAYPDDGTTMAGGDRPNPRLVSNIVFPQSAPIDNSLGISAMVWQWGQFVDHDITFVLDNSADPAFISVPTGDPSFDPFFTGNAQIPFNRSTFTQFEPGTGSPREQVNSITHWLDGSGVYGSDAARNTFLRTGTDGKLKTSAGDLLPFNDGTQANIGAGGQFTTGSNLFVAGDLRANEQVGLTSMHTLFVREHNYIADLVATNNPTFDDEQIFQLSRKIVGAEIQAITYNEWLPTLLGSNALDPYAGYDSTVDARLSNEFSAAAFRFGHTLLQSDILRLDENGVPIADGNLTLAEAFFRPDRIVNEGGIDPILRGLMAARAQEFDAKVIDDVRNLLFGPPGAVYGDVDSIDPWVGMLSEDHYQDAGVGETIFFILSNQFAALRDGDRFWYQNDPTLAAYLPEIEATSLADIIMRNTGIQNITGNVFIAPVPIPASLPLAMSALAFLGLWRKRQQAASA